MAIRPFLALVLGGGNALGSYQAGVYQALHEAGRAPDWVVGTSAGAINGALIAGNAPDHRIARLREFWQPASSGTADFWPSPIETLRRTSAALLTMGAGRPGIFGPLGPRWSADAAAAPALFDTAPLAATLARLADFDRLNAGSSGGAPRYTAGAVDLESSEDVYFDTAHQPVGPDHVRASAALIPTFPPVEIDGRAYVDGGLSANLPLDPVLGEPPPAPSLCIAVDLLPMAQRRPRTLGEAATRAQDLIFAAQSRRTIERWQAVWAHDPRFAGASLTLIRLAYGDDDAEVAGKAMDFSPASTRHRWDAGYRDAADMLHHLTDGIIRVGGPGLTVVER